MTTEYEAFFTFPDGLRWHVATKDAFKALGGGYCLALESELASGHAMGVLFGSVAEGREFCEQHWPEITVRMRLTVQPDTVGDPND